MPRAELPVASERRSLRFEKGGRYAVPIFFLLLAIGVTLFFWLPTRIPVPVNLSESYMFQFDNRTAQKILGFLLVAAFFSAKYLGLQLPASKRSTLEAPYISATTLTIAAVIIGAIAWLTCWLSLPLGASGDGAFFVDRIHQIRHGAHPYTDFEWVYGSFPLYASAALANLFHLSDVAGYDTLCVIEMVLGFVLLWFALRNLDLPSGGKRAAFLLYSVMGLELLPSMQMNYTLFRYSVAFFCVTAWTRLDRGDSRTARTITVLTSAVAVFLLMWCFPETGMAFAAATVAYLPLRRFAMRRPFIPDTLAAALLFLVTYRYFDHAGLFTTLKTFAAGAYNMPLYPDPQILILLVSLFSVGAFLAAGNLRAHLTSNVAFVAIFSVAMLAGALGRADVIHVLGYELGLVCCALVLLWRWPITWRVVLFATVMTLAVVQQWRARYDIPSYYQALMLVNLGLGRGPQIPSLIRLEQKLVKKNPLGRQPWISGGIASTFNGQTHDYEPHDIFPGISPIAFAPLLYMPGGAGEYETPSVDEGYYFGLADITSDKTVQRKLADLAAHPERDLILPAREGWPCLLPANVPFLRQVLLYPFHPVGKHDYVLFQPMCRYYERNYHWIVPPSGNTYGYGLARHN
jgi:hypothetical protein